MSTYSHAAAYSRPSPQSTSRLGKLFMAVLLIAVFEGALRKWVSSSLTLPLVATRDLLALYSIIYAFTKGLIPVRSVLFQLVLGWSALVIGWGMLQTIVNQTSPSVLAIGLRFWLLYLWFGYVCGVGMHHEDFRRASKLILYLLLAMTPLVILQQLSPPGAFINTQLDTEEKDIFIVVAGIVRPSGLFTFTLGYTSFLALAGPIALAYWKIDSPSHRSKLLFGTSFIALLIGSLLSGSRGAIIQYGAMLGIYIVGILWFAKGKAKLYGLAAAILTSLVLVAAAGVFYDAIDATQQRFSNAAEAEDFATRLQTIFLGEPEIYGSLTWFGEGLGAGSNLAGYVETGKRSFTLAETETARILLEGGLIGVFFMLLKLIAIFSGLLFAWRASILNSNPGPMVVWIIVGISIFTWSTIGQLTLNVLIAFSIAFGLLILRYPSWIIVGGRNASPDRAARGAVRQRNEKPAIALPQQARHEY